MAKRSSRSRKSQQPPPKPSPAQRRAPRADRRAGADESRRAAAGGVRVREIPGQRVWELVHPRCVRQRQEDLEEVQAMLDAGEDEIAQDELRWLLNGCNDFIEAHRMLGELALAAGDAGLARAHFGYAFDIGLAAIPRQGLAGPLPYSRPANRAFLEAGKGLAWALAEISQPDRALKVLDILLELDPNDPLGARAMRNKLNPTSG